MTDANDTFGLPQKKETAEETIRPLTAALARRKEAGRPEPPRRRRHSGFAASEGIRPPEIFPAARSMI